MVCLEGGGTRCQAALFDIAGAVLATSQSTDVNTNFVSLQAAQAAALTAVRQVLDVAGVTGECVTHFAAALVASRFGPELFGSVIPNAHYHTYTERDVIFARAGLYAPHGVAVVAATGATAWAKRADDGREAAAGGWGSLLGDEGSAYAVGLRMLRAATRLYEGRMAASSRIVEALCERFRLDHATFREGLCDVAYQKPITRAEIAGLAPIATRLAQEDDAVARQIVRRVASDLADLTVFTAERLFTPHEAFDVAAAGGLFNAGALVSAPLAQRLAEAFPYARLVLGTEEPAIALGHLLIHEGHLQQRGS
jgi:N-acetylglucosamine kinase-like BadF-type ATPase